MASTYSSNLRLELIGTGEQQGTWGSTTNSNLGTLLEQAIGGYESITISNVGDTTLTTANGSADQSRNMTLNLTGALTAARNVICPAIEKVYIVKNSTTGGFAVTLKVTGQTGISIPNGATMLLYVDGVDVRQAGAAIGASNSVQATSLEIGGTTDTTITRSAAGVIAVEGGVFPKENRTNTFSTNQVIEVTDNTNAALRVTQLGTGNALLVEDSANPDATPFVITAAGDVGVGVGGASVTSKMLVSSSSGSAPNGISGNCVARLQSTQTAGVGVGPSLLFEGQTNNSTANYSFAGIQGFKASAVAANYCGSLAFFTQNAGGGSALDEQMRIDGVNGYVGIGTTAPASKLDVRTTVSGFPFRAVTNTGTPANDAGVIIQTTASATAGARAATIYLDANGADAAGGDYLFIQIDGTSSAYIYNQASAPLILGTAGTGRLTIDNTGKVGIGTTSPADLFHVRSSGSAYQRLQVDNAGSGVGTRYINTSGHWLIGCGPVTGLGELAFYDAFNSAERMRLNQSGELIIGSTTSGSARLTVDELNSYGINARINSSGSVGLASSYMLASGSAFYGYWKYNGTVVGSISSTGSATVYATTSDYRLKSDIRPVENALQRLMLLKPVNFAWKASGNRVDGFIAHEAQEVVPDAVTGVKDGMRSVDERDEDGNLVKTVQEPDYQGIDQSKLVPLLTAALQEEINKTKSLEARIAALEEAFLAATVVPR